jgi:hypothetical protein
VCVSSSNDETDLTYFQSYHVLSFGASYLVSLHSREIPSKTSEVYGTNSAVEELKSSDKSRG